MKRVLVICGATATGKSALAVKCAKLLNSCVVSADSQLIYRGLNIGTAKPTREEMCGIRHEMIDIVPPDARFSVSDFRDAALLPIENELNAGRTPVICGGTGFYINSLLFDYSYGSAPADGAVRAKYEKLCAEKGGEYVYSLLCEADRASAEKIHKNDIKRVIRALEILEVSGIKKSELNDGFKPRFDYVAVALSFERQRLYRRIDERVDKMFKDGLVEEVKALMSAGIDENCQSMQAIGYKEVIQGLKNGDSQCTMRDIIKRNTRHYAKRQITFFKKLPGIVWMDADEASPENILKLLNC